MADTHAWQLRRGVISVVRTGSAEAALTLARGIARTAIAGIEVTLTVPDAIEVIATLTAEGVRGVGAGTVRTSAQLADCVAAGAKFLVSPHLDPDLVTAAAELGVPIIPGALTPTEIVRAMALGASAVKVFPVLAVGGLSFVKAVLEPIPDARLVVSGEVTLAEVDDYLAAGAWAACVGPGLWRARDVERGDVDAVARFAREALAQVAAASPAPRPAAREGRTAVG
jgi:2-dehydro-3-deoxyphosphogluconate aldolase / (4S)-4-hydroxy-2-oxoglutarate aldolase